MGEWGQAWDDSRKMGELSNAYGGGTEMKTRAVVMAKGLVRVMVQGLDWRRWWPEGWGCLEW